MNVVLFGSALLFKLRYLLVFLRDFFLVLVVLFLCLFDVLGHDISILDEVKNVGLLVVGLSSEVLNFSGESVHTRLGDVLLVLSVLLLSSDSILVVGEAVVLSVEVLVALLKLSDLGSHLVDEEESYFVSMTDMMVGIIFVFVILLMTFALNYREAEVQRQEKVEQLEQVEKAKEEILKDIEKSLKESGIKVEIDIDIDTLSKIDEET